MKLIDIVEQEEKQYLEWKVVANMNTRAVSYAKHNMIGSLERAGAEVEELPKSKYGPRFLSVKKYVDSSEDPKKVRQEITRAIKVVDPRAAYKFLGLKSA